MMPQKQQQTFQAFSDAARQNDILDPKTTRLLYLAAAMAVGCYP